MKKDKAIAVPSAESSIEEVRGWSSSHQTENGLAQAFAAASNKAWREDDNVYDYKVGSKEYKDAVIIRDAWFALMKEYEAEIFAILRTEGICIPKTGQIDVLTPFMKRNGYREGNGWWIADTRD